MINYFLKVKGEEMCQIN